MTPPIRLGFALTGSFCTFARVLSVLETMSASKQYEITPILSSNAAMMDTRFGAAANFRNRLESLCGTPAIDTIQAAEPIGPKAMFDILVVAPCTGNTLAKLTHSVIDSLSGSAENIGILLNRRHYYFVPFGQDAPSAKPRSLVADMERIPETITAALGGKQLQPILL